MSGRLRPTCRSHRPRTDAGTTASNAGNTNTLMLNSLEMDGYSVADRAMTDIAWQERDPIEYSRLRSGKVTLAQQQRLTDAARAFANLPIRIDPESGLKISQIAARARKHKQSLERQGKTLDALIVDHMHIVAPSNRYAGQPVREVTEISGAMKALAKELNLPVIALAQLNRSVEGRDNKRPTLSDLRESGAIEQDADLIAFVFREDKMTRAVTFTQAQVRRAVKAAESAGLRVSRVTVKPDGSITVESGGSDIVPVDNSRVTLAASWDDA
jgi:replicative DNA helicase